MAMERGAEEEETGGEVGGIPKNCPRHRCISSKIAHSNKGEAGELVELSPSKFKEQEPRH
ncbi:hypothetical protein V1478_015469 [Vespula squamosa]|uniref:Uncharacterized protein n=1 Tax=Vespula squamosa TaxID=30214 RepID=A0ABD2A560_VESSQ